MKWNKNTFLIFALRFLDSFYMIDLIHTVYMSMQGFDMLRIGMIFSVYQLSKMIFEVPTGIVADKFGRKISILCAFVFLALGNAIPLLGQIYSFFIATAIFQGISYTFLSGASEALFIDTILENDTEDSLGKYLSTARIISFLAVFLSEGLAGILWKIYGIRIVYAWTVAIELFAILVICFIKEPNTFHKEDALKITARNAFNELKSSKIASILAMMDIFTALAMIPMEKHYASYLKTYSLPEDIIGFASGMQYFLGSVIGFFVFHIIQKNANSKNIFLWGSVLKPLCIIFFTLVPNPYMKVFFYFLFVSIFCSIGPLKSEYFHSAIGSTFRATILSLVSMGMSVVALIIYPTLGFFIDTFSYDTGLLFISTLSFLGILFCVYTLRKVWLSEN